MSKLLEITLGIMSAMGGFVDVSELVFASQAGAKFLHLLLWVLPLGTIGIMVFGEMAGRAAAVAKQPVFTIIRQRLGLRLGLVTLVASSIVNVVTCAAEIGGIAIILQLLTGLPFRLMAVAATLLLFLTIWLLPFQWIERSFGLLGLLMITFMAATIAIQPDWHAVARGFIPSLPQGSLSVDLVYAYFVVGLLSAILMPYEVYFYSSGGIEEGWKPGDLTINRLTAYMGFALGSLLAMALVINAATLFAPQKIDPQLLGTTALQAMFPFGATGLVLALLGMLFSIGGAAVETCLAGAYGLAQFFGWEWGRYKGHRNAPRFALAWIAIFGLALCIVLTGVDPISLVEWSVVLSVILLPLSYFALLRAVNDADEMGRHVNGWLKNALGWAYLLLITIAALVAIPLFFLTSGGSA